MANRQEDSSLPLSDGKSPTGTIIEITLCEITGAQLQNGRCPVHPDPELEDDCKRRGIAFIAGCAARYVHHSWVTR